MLDRELDPELDPELWILEALYSPDGMWLIFRVANPSEAVDDIYAIRPRVDTVATPLVTTEFEERYPALSPNGRWLAYVSNDTGQEAIYVSPFPAVASGRVLVSRGGGTEPAWAHSGVELFYRNGANELVAVQFMEDPTFMPGRQDVLFPMDDYQIADGSRVYAVAPDDRSFVMLRIGEEDADDSELIIVTNWLEELSRLVPD